MGDYNITKFAATGLAENTLFLKIVFNCRSCFSQNGTQDILIIEVLKKLPYFLSVDKDLLNDDSMVWSGYIPEQYPQTPNTTDKEEASGALATGVTAIKSVTSVAAVSSVFSTAVLSALLALINAL